MGFLRKLFSRSFSMPLHQSNGPLIDAIHEWHIEDSKENFDKVLLLLTVGDAVLFLTSKHAWKPAAQEKTASDKTIQLTCVWQQEGVKTLTAYTDEKTLYEKTGETNYIKLPADDVLQLCRDNSIRKIVIISGLLEIFVLQWQE